MNLLSALVRIFETIFARWVHTVVNRLLGLRFHFLTAICISALTPRFSAIHFCLKLRRSSTVLFNLILKMMLSLFYAFLLLAAGSNASPCRLQSGNSTSSSSTAAKAALHPNGNLQSGNWTSSSTTGAKAAPHRDGHGSAAVIQNQKLGTQANAGLDLPLPYSQESSSPSSTSASVATPSVAASGSSGSSSGSGSSTTSDISGSLTPASGSCPQGFLNTVFNTNAGQSSGFPSATWTTLTDYGIDSWSTSTLAAPKT